MIALGIIAIVLSLLIPGATALFTIGWVLIAVGVVLLIARPGGRRYY